MFDVNDYIMYGLTGVCKVEDITDVVFRDGIKKKYYVLYPVYSKGTVIKTPIDNDKVVMRKIITKNQANNIMSNIDKSDDEWISNDRVRSEEFKKMLKSCECEQLLRLVKSLYSSKDAIGSEGKKNHKSDEDIMKEAERLINEEFSMVLELPIEEVVDHIKSKFNKE